MTVDRSGLPVRLVVLNHDGGDLTLRCLEHIEALDWPADRLQVVCVDNASADGSPDEIARRFPDVDLVRLPTNGGFGANNVALAGADELRAVGLVNNDAFVEPRWLGELVEALEADPGLGAVCPKIVLEPRYCTLSIHSTAMSAGRGDRREVGVRVRSVHVDGVDRTSSSHLGSTGWGRESDRRGPYEWTRPDAILHVPAPGESGAFTVRMVIEAPSRCTVRLEGAASSVETSFGPGEVDVEVEVTGERIDVLNNVGSVILDDGYGADRGWLEIDRGQLDEPVDVVAWCGGGVLLRPEYLADVGLLDERFFLYYEDTDLSWRGRARGWRYRTVPTARMRHHHSATTGAVSDLTLHLTERNRLVMLVRNARASMVMRATVRYLIITASYARRDVLGRLLARRSPDKVVVRRRIRSFGAFLAALRWAVPSRRDIRRHRRLPDAVIERELTPRD